jgi:hypothetical protein
MAKTLIVLGPSYPSMRKVILIKNNGVNVAIFCAEKNNKNGAQPFRQICSSTTLAFKKNTFFSQKIGENRLTS